MNKADDKAALRNTMREIRKSIGLLDRDAYESALQNRLFNLPAFKHINCIAAYNPVDSEARFSRRISSLYALKDNMTVGFPVVCSDTEMVFLAFEYSDDRTILENPKRIITNIDPARILLPETIDLILVPGIAFDRHGNRLGQGGGYYDRYLPKLRNDCLIIGIAFDEQIVDEIPHGPKDHKVDYVVTPTRVISAEK